METNLSLGLSACFLCPGSLDPVHQSRQPLLGVFDEEAERARGSLVFPHFPFRRGHQDAEGTELPARSGAGQVQVVSPTGGNPGT